MTRYGGAWTESETEEYLDQARVPLRLACHRPDESLWMVALWYRFRNGSFECATWAEADLVTYLRNDSEVAFEVSENEPPYRGVRGNGTTSLSQDDEKGVLADLIERYLGDTNSELAAWLLDEKREEVRIRIRPRRIHTWDYTERMREVADQPVEPSDEKPL